jgi:hypothetical protein
MMEAARTSETMVNFYQTIRRYNQEDSHLLRTQTRVEEDDGVGILTKLRKD